MSVFIAALVDALILLFLTELFCCIPILFANYKLSNYGKYKKIKSILNCFAGGVFLTTCFEDILPAAQDSFEKTKIDSSKPYVELLTLLGFIVILVIEQFAAMLQGTGKNLISQVNTENVPLTQESRESLLDSVADTSSIESNDIVNTDLVNFNIKNHEMEHSSNSQVLKVVLLVIALSVHSIFEGLAIGCKTTVKEIFILTASVSIHKLIIAFSIGLNISTEGIVPTQSNRKFMFQLLLRTIKTTIAFALASPIGIFIGALIQTNLHGFVHDLTNTICQSLSAGTFIYVVFFEILSDEFTHNDANLNQRKTIHVKLLSFILGFVAITVIEFSGLT
ncbi:Solute carrier family 39 member 1 [Intoshia linei]|uniref:Solute carrier family 39 member 1 n=1 Tax=Intoshia linei TaxID=1819745 RepID=A0A177AZP0_9BILA|nr:Solute carrier family 39 member 1 [Intoshia linei]